MCVCQCAEVRGQPMGIGSRLLPSGAWCLTHIPSLDSKSLCPLSHFAGLCPLFWVRVFHWTWSSPIWQGGPASELWWAACLHPASAAWVGAVHWMPGFYTGLGSKCRSSQCGKHRAKSTISFEGVDASWPRFVRILAEFLSPNLKQSRHGENVK